MADHQVPGAKLVATKLGLGDVDVLIADAVVGSPKETDALAHDLQDTAAQFDALLLGLRLADLQDQSLLLEAIEIGDIEVLGDRAQSCQRFVFKLQNFHVGLCLPG